MKIKVTEKDKPKQSQKCQKFEPKYPSVSDYIPSHDLNRSYTNVVNQNCFLLTVISFHCSYAHSLIFVQNLF